MTEFKTINVDICPEPTGKRHKHALIEMRGTQIPKLKSRKALLDSLQVSHDHQRGIFDN